MKDSFAIVILQFLIVFFAFFAMDYAYRMHGEMTAFQQEMVMQKKALVLIVNDMRLKNDLIEKQKAFILTLEEDNRMLYKELFDANEKIRERAIKFELYGDAKIQKAF